MSPVQGSAGTSTAAAANSGSAGQAASGGMSITSTAGTAANSAGSGASGPVTLVDAGSMRDLDAGPAPDAATTITDAATPTSHANDLWISPQGSDTDPGTQAKPLASLTAAVDRVKPGLTIWVNPGTYAVAKTVALKTSGTAASPIAIFALPGDRPVFDFMAQPRADSSARGLELTGDYWHIRGINVMNAGDNCIHIGGSHNTIENVDIRACEDTGLQITADGSQAGDASRAAYNTILNCDSHENYDAQNQGENADGFAAKLYIGPGNVFRGCRSWNNADDGWDLFASNDVVVIEDCWAIANGKIGPSQNNTNGDGNGFKLGGAPKAGDANMGGAVHQVKGCIAIENAACGFVRNNNPDVPQLSMCGGRGNKTLFCSVTDSDAVTVGTAAAAAISAKRDADGKLPALP